MKINRFKFNNMADNVENLTDQIGQVSMDMEDTINSVNMNEYDIMDLPNSIIVTNLDDAIFENELERLQFEAVFKEFQEDAPIFYLKSFRRARIDYESPNIAARARIQFNETEICGKLVKCFFAQPLTLRDGSGPTLQPPEPTKQFLISPPASPPVGWEPIREGEPVINYDLLAAIASLQPGEAHELHKQTDNQPGIVVHVCENPEGYLDKAKPKIVQTKRPDQNS